MNRYGRVLGIAAWVIVLLVLTSFLIFFLSITAEAQSRSNVPNYWRRMAGVLSPMVSTDTVSVPSLTLTSPLLLGSGGTNASLTANTGGIFYSTNSAAAILSGTATANKVLMSGSTAAPTWSVPTFPNASATAGKVIRSDGTNYAASTSTFADTYGASTILYSNGANTVTGLATGNDGVLITSGTGVPSISSTLPAAVQGNITSLGTIAGSLTVEGDAVVGKNEAVGHQLKLYTGANNDTEVWFYSHGDYGFKAGNYGTAGAKYFQLRNNAGDPVISAGPINTRNVGIGVAIPLYRLHVEGTTSALSKVLIRNSVADAAGNSAELLFAPEAAFDGVVIYGAGIKALTDGLYSTALVFSQFDGANVVEHMRLSSAGNLFVSGSSNVGSYTDPSNYEYGTLTQTAGIITLSAATAGSGTDNIDIALVPIGTGDIRMGKALVALGGGAVPTVGTIGGSGPTNAAQNSWLQLEDSAGNLMWIPIWK